MLHIIGTAGHVDHGKTALIESLTDTNTDRLPEEKEREMTIDLGFAYFDGPHGNPVGVIDVPGHERFIRNMVAGAWSLSCAMLVVAANEEWMQQTEDHCLVLKAMEIREIICVITKSDTASKAQINDIIQKVKLNLHRHFQREVAIMTVSSLSGQGIESLKSFLIDLLQDKDTLTQTQKGYIHIDRVFTIKGAGTVITGSLSGGELSVGDEITILPKNIRTKIRSIQSYYKSLTTAYPVSRVACNLHGIKKEDISRGDLAVVQTTDFHCENEFIIQFEERNTGTIKNHKELEVAFGTGHHTVKIHFLPKPGLARIVFTEKVAAAWMQPFIFIRHGGYSILGKGHFIFPGSTSLALRKRIVSVLEKYPIPSFIKDESVLRFLLDQWYLGKTESELNAIKRFTATINSAVRLIGTSAILEELFQCELQKLIQLTSKRGGVTIPECLSSSSLPPKVMNSAIDEALKSKAVIQRGQILLSSNQLSNDKELTPMSKILLEMFHGSGKKGLQLKEVKKAGAHKELSSLIRTGKVVALEGEIFYTEETFTRLTESILKGRKTGSTFTIFEARQDCGLSRKYLLPLLNKMEEKRLVKRNGDVRVVL